MSPQSAPDPGAAPVSRGQRALWTFLIITLVGPALAGVLLFLASIAAGLFTFGPPSLHGLTTSALLAAAGERALTAFVWSAMPSGLAGAALAALVALNGKFGWLIAAVAGVAAFAAMAIPAGG